MKDIRLCALADGRVAVFTRPRGAKGGRGTTGHAAVASLDTPGIAAIDAAPPAPLLLPAAATTNAR